MKIGDLRTENKHLYYLIMRSRIWWQDRGGLDLYPNRGDKALTTDEIEELTVKDIFELFDEAAIRRLTYGLGDKTFAQLKDLA